MNVWISSFSDTIDVVQEFCVPASRGGLQPKHPRESSAQLPIQQRAGGFMSCRNSVLDCEMNEFSEYITYIPFHVLIFNLNKAAFNIVNVNVGAALRCLPTVRQVLNEIETQIWTVTTT